MFVVKGDRKRSKKWKREIEKETGDRESATTKTPALCQHQLSRQSVHAANCRVFAWLPWWAGCNFQTVAGCFPSISAAALAMGAILEQLQAPRARSGGCKHDKVQAEAAGWSLQASASVLQQGGAGGLHRKPSRGGGCGWMQAGSCCR